MRLAAPPLPPPAPVRARPPAGGVGPVARVALLSTYPPTPCGLATFGAALVGGIEASGTRVDVVRVLDGPTEPTPASVPGRIVGALPAGSPSAAADAARLLGAADVAIVQHEYGLYGGRDGDEVLAVLAAVRTPVVLIAHTVLATPTSRQRDVLRRAVELSDHVVVMSTAARERLCAVFGVSPSAVTTIPHGAAVARGTGPPVETSRMLTWGLVGPGKGMDRVIGVLPQLVRRNPTTRYVIAGRTHPKVLASQGEAYRDGLTALARTRGVAAAVSVDPTYHDRESLDRLVRSSGVVVLPYDSTEQVTSGVLVDAVAAGRPVVATAFPHAVELLASGAGIVVPHDDPDALELALSRVLIRPRVQAAMAAEAARLAPAMGWPVVARAHLRLAASLVAAGSTSA